MDDGHEGSEVVNGVGDAAWIDQSIGARHDAAHRMPVALEERAACFGRRVLDRRRDDYRPLPMNTSGAADRDVACLGSAAGEYDLILPRADERCDLGTG